jgi:hypothetical protein
VSDWYYADSEGHVGPLTLQELKETLATFPDARNVFVWCESFTDWKRAWEVPELREQTKAPPPLPNSHLLGEDIKWSTVPTWQVKRWWYVVALLFFGVVGSREGRKAMIWIAAERKRVREIRRRA